jgi:DNA processing protein
MTPSRSHDATRVMRCVVPTDDAYPRVLHDLPNPPAMLWGVGDWSMLEPPIVAIVGTRRATPYGERITRELAMAFSRAGACIVSGMALGIDAAAHRAALDAGGRTIAVLGTGVDIAYPRANRALYQAIAERGLLLSELSPGDHSHKGSFINRNRIIAALAAMTIVVEAPVKSGALHTAKFADLLDRTVAAVPGPIDMPQSEGTNLLIRDAAQIITSVEDALALVGLSAPALGARALETEAERCVWSALTPGPATLDDLCMRSGLPVSECMVAVSALEIRGALECSLTGEIRRR